MDMGRCICLKSNGERCKNKVGKTKVGKTKVCKTKVCKTDLDYCYIHRADGKYPAKKSIEKNSDEINIELDKNWSDIDKDVELGKNGKKVGKKDEKNGKDLFMHFFSMKKELRSLSNFYVKDVVIKRELIKRELTKKIDLVGSEGVIRNQRTYESGEHAFHGEKFFRISGAYIEGDRLKECNERSDRSEQLIKFGMKFLKPSNLTCFEAKKLGGVSGGLVLNEKEVKYFLDISLEMQMDICSSKFETDEKVVSDLKKSIGKVLIHPSIRAKNVEGKFWSGRGVLTENGTLKVEGGNNLGKIWMEIRKRVEAEAEGNK